MPVKFEFKQNEKKYWNFIKKLRNSLNNTNSFIQNVHITDEMHENYMNSHSDKYFIALLDGEPAGYVGVIDNDIRIAVAPNKSSLGVGKFMLAELNKNYPNATARVLIGNESSKALFEKSGFTCRWYYYEREK